MIQIPAPLFRPPFAVTRMSHVVLQVRDLAASRAFYVDTLGFIVSDATADALYLRGIEEACHHSLVLRRSDTAACRNIGMRVQTEEDLDEAAAWFAKAGIATQWAEEPHQHRSLQLHDHAGMPFEFCASMETRPRMIMAFEAHHGPCPQRIDHVQLLTPQVESQMRFYMDIGFRVSEYIVTDDDSELLFAFMQRKGNPHDVVFAKGAGPRIHHMAFMVPEAHHLLLAADTCARNGFGQAVEFGPGRHYGPGYARFIYLRDPDGHRIELFNCHYQCMDAEDVPERWHVSDLYGPKRWGGPPPASWREEGSTFA